jgi:hypothetical protein
MAHLDKLDPEGELSPIAIHRDLAFVQPATRKGHAYWHGLCGERPMPARGDLRPRAMREFLDHVNLVDVIADGADRFDYAVSLQGTRGRDLFGHMQGRRFSEMFPPALEARWRDSFEVIRVERAPMRFLTRASTFGKKWLLCEALLAPLGDEVHGLNAIFWVFASWRDT